MSRLASRVRLLLAWAAMALVLSACAQLPRRPADAPQATGVQSGRLALSVQSEAAQSFSAAFELRGRPEAGQLGLFNPLGGTLALLQWQPGQAVLSVPGRSDQQFDSLDAMVEQATGGPLPVTALFDWLAGTPTPVPGWEVDLSQLPEGRLRARRLSPPPPADLRIVLDL